MAAPHVVDIRIWNLWPNKLKAKTFMVWLYGWYVRSTNSELLKLKAESSGSFVIALQASLFRLIGAPPLGNYKFKAQAHGRTMGF